MEREREALIALMQELRQALGALTSLLRRLEQQAQRPPVQLDVAHLEVERLEFHLDSIDIDDLQGELHLGICQQVKLEGPVPLEGGAPSPAEPQPALSEVAIWPPPVEEVEAEP
ncbi:MAG: hypothetical protein ACOY94_13405 [Bacillota bacterium]